MKLKTNKQRGITLVALVVTIVVLLILAGITIAYAFGDNSIFQKAVDAKEQTEKAAFEERLGVVTSVAFIERTSKGGLTPEEFFELLKKHSIITDTTVPGENIAAPIEKEDGSKTYDITSDDGNVFEATIYPDGRVETDYLGKEGKLKSKIRGIGIVEKTKTSLKIKVSARIEGSGTVKCYYKKASEVAVGEKESDITGYTEVVLDGDLVGAISGLTQGTTYKIKAVVQSGEESNWLSIHATTDLKVTKITLKETTITIDIGKIKTLEVTAIEPSNAADKTVSWSSDKTNIATVSSSGVVTGVAVGTATITATANDGSGVKATCSVTVEELDSDWEEIGEIAKAIARSSVTSNDSQATVTVNGESKTIKVGDIYKLKYNGEIRRVRVLGFKHDDLVDTGVYGEGITANKASISFEFYDFMTGNIYKPMNSSATNSGGWGATEMRVFLNGAEGKEKLSNKSYIKQVTKKYIKEYSNAGSVTTCNDYLWLLAASEVVNAGYQNGAYGYAITSEGSQYKYYQGVTAAWNTASTGREKYNASGSSISWWLRSPTYNSSSYFCGVNSTGHVGSTSIASNSSGVAPGFSI